MESQLLGAKIAKKGKKVLYFLLFFVFLQQNPR